MCKNCNKSQVNANGVCKVKSRKCQQGESFSLHEKQAAVHVADKSNNCITMLKIFLSEKLLRHGEKLMPEESG